MHPFNPLPLLFSFLVRRPFFYPTHPYLTFISKEEWATGRFAKLSGKSKFHCTSKYDLSLIHMNSYAKKSISQRRIRTPCNFSKFFVIWWSKRMNLYWMQVHKMLSFFPPCYNDALSTSRILFLPIKPYMHCFSFSSCEGLPSWISSSAIISLLLLAHISQKSTAMWQKWWKKLLFFFFKGCLFKMAVAVLCDSCSFSIWQLGRPTTNVIARPEE